MNIPRKVYAICHNVTNRVYIGSSAEVEKRFKAHISALKGHRHIVEDMQEDFDKYGEDYTFTILDEITCYEERYKEYEWMKKLDSYKREVGYNYKDHHITRYLKHDEKAEIWKEPKQKCSNHNFEALQFADRMKKAMLRANKRQIDVSRESGIAKGTINNYLCGKYKPKHNSVIKIAKSLDVSEQWLMGCNVPIEHPEVEPQECRHEGLTQSETELMKLIREQKDPVTAMMKAFAIISLFLAAETQSKALMNSMQ